MIKFVLRKNGSSYTG